MNIYIQAPPWDHRSGGCRVLHYLGYLATLAGHRVTMLTHALNPEWGEYSLPPAEGQAEIYFVVPEVDRRNLNPKELFELL